MTTTLAAPRRRPTAAAFAHALQAAHAADSAGRVASRMPPGAWREGAEAHAQAAAAAALRALGRAWQPEPGPTPPSTQAWNLARAAQEQTGAALGLAAMAVKWGDAPAEIWG